MNRRPNSNTKGHGLKISAKITLVGIALAILMALIAAIT